MTLLISRCANQRVDISTGETSAETGRGARAMDGSARWVTEWARARVTPEWKLRCIGWRSEAIAAKVLGHCAFGEVICVPSRGNIVPSRGLCDRRTHAVVKMLENSVTWRPPVGDGSRTGGSPGNGYANLGHLNLAGCRCTPEEALRVCTSIAHLRQDISTHK